jgi:hypothetical protein
MKGPVIAWSNLAGKRVSGYLGGKDRTQTNVEQAGSTLGLMDRGHTQFYKTINDVQGRPWGTANYYCHDSPLNTAELRALLRSSMGPEPLGGLPLVPMLAHWFIH